MTFSKSGGSQQKALMQLLSVCLYFPRSETLCCSPFVLSCICLFLYLFLLSCTCLYFLVPVSTFPDRRLSVAACPLILSYSQRSLFSGENGCSWKCCIKLWQCFSFVAYSLLVSRNMLKLWNWDWLSIYEKLVFWTNFILSAGKMVKCYDVKKSQKYKYTSGKTQTYTQTK